VFVDVVVANVPDVPFAVVQVYIRMLVLDTLDVLFTRIFAIQDTDVMVALLGIPEMVNV
jgi:hypothetical protein